jgi:hypothetical protein
MLNTGAEGITFEPEESQQEKDLENCIMHSFETCLLNILLR